ncbi:MAG: alanine--tRNA ligase [Bacillota bacterium]|nr:alanine--tRNA ligase [Bacillota bacterium]
MRSLSSSEIRTRFLRYFAERGHTVVPSSPLVPQNDPTLLFTNAGMVQFKDVFLGNARLPFQRATTAQKCMRAGGKHNDLENVGRTPRHHTFFEMLGNFSFGDYFKADAIRFAWEFLTGELELDPERLWVTIYEEDDEAEQLWRSVAGVPAGRIVRLGEKDNFWAMGETGPCGPCSEIIYDRGEEHRCDAPVCGIGACDCDRWLEVWNLVFMQYDRDQAGVLHPLPKPSIDTGMGLERIASVLQGVDSNFDTDLFHPVVRRIEELTGRRYDRGSAGFPFRVIADHARAGAFLVADGVLPSNDGRGYVLRRILRRAARFGRVLGLERPFLGEVVESVVAVMGDAYPELRERQAFIRDVIRREEERFQQTLEQGMRAFADLAEKARAEGRHELRGEDAFLLYDTYGFPLDLAQDMAEEAGLAIDLAGFQAALERQRERARADRAARGLRAGDAVAQLVADLPATRFLGYEGTEGRARVLALVLLDETPARVEEAEEGSEVRLVLDQTPFYAEGGGQVGDTGWLLSDEARVRITDTQEVGRGIHLHFGRVEAGTLRAGAEVEARVDADRRRAIMRNHSATHLLHKALKEILGEEATQAGSLVAPDRLRFDFTHDGALDEETLRRVEDRVNRVILEALPATVQVLPLEEARRTGAVALFGEKYGERVRVVSMGDYSKELCGGTHVHNTAEIGAFKIVGESSIGSNLRRIEAVTGLGVVEVARLQESRLRQAAQILRAPEEELVARTAALSEELHTAQRRIRELEERLARVAAERLLERVETVAGVRIVRGELEGVGPEELRQASDWLRQKLGSGVVLLATRSDGKIQFVAAVTADLVQRGVHAGKIVSAAARVAGGGGGGRPDLAQAGGRRPELLESALSAGLDALRELAG